MTSCGIVIGVGLGAEFFTAGATAKPASLGSGVDCSGYLS
jgi:hypothetical protein